MSRAWLGSLLRARQMQEDLAKERLAHAQRHALGAEVRTRTEDKRVRAMMHDVAPATATAFAGGNKTTNIPAAMDVILSY